MNRQQVALLVGVAAMSSGLARAQTIEERARAAADASRAKAGDSEAIQQNYLTPGLSGQPVRTVDNSRTFTPNLACQKTATLLEVLIHPDPSGDIGTVRVSRDKDLDGHFDTSATLPVAVSGVCANGIISCAPGSWNSCRFFQWSLDDVQALKLTEVSLPELAGCYCVNNSCGTNLVLGNLSSVLSDLGGGIVGALTSADPRTGIAQAQINGPIISYVGAQTTACTTNPSVAQTGYRTNPTAILSDAFAASSGNSIFQALAASPVGMSRSQETRTCTIERQIIVSNPAPEDIIWRAAGGYATQQNGSHVDFLMGSPQDDALSGGGCRLFDFRMTLHVGDPDRLLDARLSQIYFDDWTQIRVDGKLVFADPASWLSAGLPPGGCERGRTWYASPNLDLKPYLTPGDHEIWMRVAVGGEGEALAQVSVDLDTSCRTTEQIIDHCAANAASAHCRLEEEIVDGAKTVINGVATGLRPLPQTRIPGGASCPIEFTRDYFLKERRYRCTIDTLPMPDTSRGAYIIDHSTETMLSDRLRQPDGSFAFPTRDFSVPDRVAVPACEPICKTRAPKANTDAAPDGVVGSKQNTPVGYDIFYHACTGENVCPAGADEEIVSACGCLDDFPEAVVMMQAVRLAGADLVCTDTTP